MSTSARRFGKYELQERLGRGGMAEVWKAFDTQLRRYVAIKFLHADFQADPDFVSRFTREAQTIAALRHPNIVQIYDFYISESNEREKNTSPNAGTTESSVVAYMVMEYIQGETLAHYIHNTSHKGDIPAADVVVRLFTPISLGLDYAHRQGTIHRDIKPANILLDQRNTSRNAMGEPILSDFGLAKLLNAASQTATGTVFGTPLYISPEQVQNRPVSNRTDIYAVGVMLYEILTGAPPFHGDSLTGIMMQHLTEQPVPAHKINPHLPPAVSAVLLKSLAKKPQDRYPSAAALTAAIAKAFDLPVPQELRSADTMDDSERASEQTQRAQSPLNAGSSPATQVATDQQVARAGSDKGGATADEALFPNTVPPVGASSSPVNLPDSDAQLEVPGDTEDRTMLSRPSLEEQATILSTGSPGAQKESNSPVYEQPTILAQGAKPASENGAVPIEMSSPPVTPQPEAPPPAAPSPPPAPVQKQDQGLRIALVAILIVVLVAGGLGTFFALNHGNTPATTGASTIVGNASFVSGGQLNLRTNQGSNDELQISLHNITAPQSGNSYYAWLLPDKTQAESPSVFLGTLSVKNGTVNFLYKGDSNHTNLLGITSRFLITEEPANSHPDVPSLDPTIWRYYAELPQTPVTGQQYTLLDHLRHLLAIDPDLQKVHMNGGLNIWLYRNTQQVYSWSVDARNDWDTHSVTLMRQHIVSILDYLDGSKFVGIDVSPDLQTLAHPDFMEIGLLNFSSDQQPPGYLYHVALHLQGVVQSPGSTQNQQKLAVQINTGITNVKGELNQVRADAIKLVKMSDTQLTSQPALSLLNDMQTQANAAFNGTSSSSGQMNGVQQIYTQVQGLATFEVKPYSSK